jgi:hypothetical protein
MEQQADTSIEDGVYRRAARLLAVQHAVAEIAGGRKVEADPAALRDAVMQVQRAVRSVEGAYACFIGGLAVQHLGYERWTDDVDVVVDAAHYGDVLDRLRTAGFAITKDWSLVNKHTGAKLDLLREGVTLKDARFPLPHPQEMGPNTGYARVGWVIRLKLEARRQRDFADIVELLKRRPAEAGPVRAALPEVMRSQFDDLCAQAQKEGEP